MEQSMIDAASEGVLMDKTSVIARHLISNMAVRGPRRSWHLKGNLRQLKVENQLTELMSLVRQLAIGQHQQVVQHMCGICTSVEHLTDMCPTLQEDESENIECVGALGGGH
ncbi:hypothetical protein CR513_61808, partial [Mucuna pruriens]